MDGIVLRFAVFPSKEYYLLSKKLVVPETKQAGVVVVTAGGYPTRFKFQPDYRLPELSHDFAVCPGVFHCVL
jgi:hypothetical protein